MKAGPAETRFPSVLWFAGPCALRYTTYKPNPIATSHTETEFTPSAIPMASPANAQLMGESMIRIGDIATQLLEAYTCFSLISISNNG